MSCVSETENYEIWNRDHESGAAVYKTSQSTCTVRIWVSELNNFEISFYAQILLSKILNLRNRNSAYLWSHEPYLCLCWCMTCIFSEWWVVSYHQHSEFYIYKLNVKRSWFIRTGKSIRFPGFMLCTTNLLFEPGITVVLWNRIFHSHYMHFIYEFSLELP